MDKVYAAFIAIGLLGLNIWLLLQNKKVPVPEGCENLQPNCEACGMSDCSIRKEKNIEEMKGE